MWYILWVIAIFVIVTIISGIMAKHETDSGEIDQ